MTTMEKTFGLVMKFKRKGFTSADLNPETSLVSDLNFDSLDMAELLFLAEDTFAIEVPLEDAMYLQTIGNAAAYFERRLAD